MIAVPFAIHAEDVLNYDMTSMGGFNSESSDGQAIVDEYFEGGVSTDTILAIPFGDKAQLSEIDRKLIASGALSDEFSKRFGDDVSLTVMGSYGKEGSGSGVFLVGITFADGVSGINKIGDVRAAVDGAKESAGLTDMRTYVTGNLAITYDTMDGANRDVAKIDPLSILLIILLLGLFFWTVVTAAVPPLVVGTAYGVVLALMYALGSFFDIFYITKTIVLVSMLGAGCDYSIFIIARYREERKRGEDRDKALTEAIMWAGESVLTSGLAVIIGFAVMSLCSLSIISTMAMVLALGIVMAMLGALTLIPAIVALLGDRVFWPRTIDSYKAGSRERNGPYGRLVDFGKRHFSRAGRFSTKHAAPIVIVALLLTAPLAYVAFTAEDSFDMISVMPDSEAKEGVQQITDNTDGGLIMPTYALLQLESPIARVTPIADGIGVLMWTEDGMRYLDGLVGIENALKSSDDNISYALGPTSWSSVYGMAKQALIGKGVPESMITPDMVNQAAVSVLPSMVALQLTEFFDSYGWNIEPSTVIPQVGAPVSGLIDYSVNIGAGLVSGNGQYLRIMVIVKDEPMSSGSMDSIKSIRDTLTDLSSQDQYSWISGTWVTGTAATLYDISDVVNEQFTWIELGVILLIYVLLFFVIGSYLTPVRSLATIMMSVIWTLGLVQLVFAQALASDVIWIVPIVLFVICLGLGMDYDILVTTRIREGKLKGMTNDEAIINAIERSGPIITLCGLLMGGTFLTLLLSGSLMLQELGFALGFAILVDSLIVVPYVVPALMHLMGDWSWKGPRFLNRRAQS